eukprot:5510858-Alexandrium_andersonii.AAC.1
MGKAASRPRRGPFCGQRVGQDGAHEGFSAVPESADILRRSAALGESGGSVCACPPFGEHCRPGAEAGRSRSARDPPRGSGGPRNPCEGGVAGE